MPRALLLLVLFAACLFAACASESDDGSPPSIVFVSVDTLSARHTSLHGYARPTTPGLERLAESSVVFERAWANAPWTTPSYMSQFTGLFPAAFRRPVVEDGGSAWAFADEHLTLAEVARAAGLRTAAFVDNWNAGPQLGLDQGFELYDTSAAERGLEDTAGGIEHVVPRALAWLDALDEDEPFLLFVQVLDVHGPYLAGREPTDARAAVLAVPGPVASRAVPIALEQDGILGAIPLYVAEPVAPDGARALDVAPLADDYDAGVRRVDAELARFVEALEARGVLDRALLVVSADHGESLVAHDSYFDHQLLHGEDLHVPLVLRPPGGCAPRRVATDVQLVDLLPTVAELLGATIPNRHGRSLAPALRGDPLPAVPIVAHGDFLGARSVVLDGWKLVETRPSPENAGVTGYLTTPAARAWIGERFPDLAGKVFGTHELPPETLLEADVGALFEESRAALTGPFRRLYDLADDPGETRDLAAAHPRRVAALLEVLEREEARARDAFRDADAPVLDEDVRAELEKLGYTEER